MKYLRSGTSANDDAASANYFRDRDRARVRVRLRLRELMIYLDYNATTPLCDAAREAMLPYLGSALWESIECTRGRPRDTRGHR